MPEIIIFIIIIAVVIQNSKKKGQSRPTPPVAAGKRPPSESSFSRPAQPAKAVRGKKSKKENRKSFSTQEKEDSSPILSRMDEPLETRTFIEPTKAYRPPRNAGERYEEWMPVPEGKQVCRCGYCGADNLIPKRSNPKDYSCYFCREEL